MLHSIAHRLMFAVIVLAHFTSPLVASDRVTSGEFIIEPPTLISLGFEWQIQGDDNRNAAVSVFYRRKGETPWREGLPLLRIGAP
jgi:hypothetical protein